MKAFFSSIMYTVHRWWQLQHKSFKLKTFPFEKKAKLKGTINGGCSSVFGWNLEKVLCKRQRHWWCHSQFRFSCLSVFFIIAFLDPFNKLFDQFWQQHWCFFYCGCLQSSILLGLIYSPLLLHNDGQNIFTMTRSTECFRALFPVC